MSADAIESLRRAGFPVGAGMRESDHITHALLDGVPQTQAELEEYIQRLEAALMREAEESGSTDRPWIERIPDAEGLIEFLDIHHSHGGSGTIFLPDQPADLSATPDNSYEARRARREAALAAQGSHNGMATADLLFDELREHNATEQPLKDAMKQALANLKDSDRPKHDAFGAHMEHACVAAETPVRRFDIISWFVLIPNDLKTAVEDLADSYHKQVKLSIDLSRLEWRETPNHREEVYAWRRGATGLPWGFESPSIENFTLDTELQPVVQLKNMRANFEIRKVRLEQADSSTRATEVEKWEDSVDCKVGTWAMVAQEHCLSTLSGEEADQMDQDLADYLVFITELQQAHSAAHPAQQTS